MNPDELPRCEWPDGKSGLIFYNCTGYDSMVRAAENRVEQITKQLNCPHGLTNRERSALAKERQRLQRWMNQGRPAGVAIDEAHQTRKRKREKARESKLEWLARKVGGAKTAP
jgi:hypothetical protein